MRLGFAVAAFLDADVLLVDEVLAVGDASFQQKCLDRMRQLINGGTTLVLVSHDLPAMEATCSRAVWLRKGSVALDGPVRETLSSYREAIEQAAEPLEGDAAQRFKKVEVLGPGGGSPRSGEALDIRLVVENQTSQWAVIGVGVSEGPAAPVWVVRHDVHLDPGETEIRCTVERVPLPRGRFYVWTCLFEPHGTDLIPWHPAAHFDLYGPELDPAPLAVVRLAPVHVDVSWEFDHRR